VKSLLGNPVFIAAAGGLLIAAAGIAALQLLV